MFDLVDAEKANYPLVVLCDVLDVSRSGFYARQTRPPSMRTKADAQLAVEITATHEKSGKRYGSPRVHRALRKKGVDLVNSDLEDNETVPYAVDFRDVLREVVTDHLGASDALPVFPETQPLNGNWGVI